MFTSDSSFPFWELSGFSSLPTPPSPCSANVGYLMKHYPPTWGSTLKTLIGCLSLVVVLLLVAVALYLVAPLVM